MKVFGQAKITKIEKTKIGQNDAHKGELAWQKPKQKKDEPVEYVSMPFLIFGKSGDSLDKYHKDKNGKPRYFIIGGDLSQGKEKYIRLSSWEFPTYEASTDNSSQMPEEDPF